MTKEIVLSNGFIALVDDEDYEKYKDFTWNIHTKKNHYPCRRCQVAGKQKTVFLHREIMEVKEGNYVDHINGNKLDNRKENLRIVTQSQNNKNLSLRSNNTSGYKGVTWDKRRQKWISQIGSDGKHYFIGYFRCKNEAARAYNARALELFGEFARLNEIPDDISEIGNR